MLEESTTPSKLPTILLSILTAPFLLTIVTVESLTNSLIEFGQASEELFRGERLPMLDSEAEDPNNGKGN